MIVIVSIRAAFLSAFLVLFAAPNLLAAPTTTPHTHRRAVKHKHAGTKAAHKAGWAGAGLAAGQAIGPAGSAAVGATQYRRDLKAGGHRRRKAIVKVGVPIGVGVVAGPVGSAGYAAIEHRHWIKHHILRQKPKPPKRRYLRKKPRGSGSR